MISSQDLPGLAGRKSVTALSWLLSMIAGLALGMNIALAQEEDGDADEEEALELQDVRVTGSRLNRPPAELSGNLIVLDREDIRASGELTLARVLRQLPQNINATNETFGSDFNGNDQQERRRDGQPAQPGQRIHADPHRRPAHGPQRPVRRSLRYLRDSALHGGADRDSA